MKKVYAYLIVLLLVCAAALSALVCCVKPHTHQAEYIPATQPNCSAEGSSGYYYCAECGKYFSDKACENEISKEDAVLPKNDEHDWGEWKQTTISDCTHEGERTRACSRCGKTETQITPAEHTLLYHGGKQPTCTQAGYEPYLRCSTCGALFTQTDKLPISQPPVLPAAHKPVLQAQAPSTCSAVGRKEHYACSACGKLFEDIACTREVSPEQLALPLEAHTYNDEHICSACFAPDYDHYTPGLKFGYVERKMSLIGLGEAQGDIVVQPYYDGVPVTEVAALAAAETGEEHTLTSIILPDSVTAIRSGAFTGCSALQSIVLPAGLKSVAESAFTDCGITEITLPNGLENLGIGAFAGCALTNITLPEGLESVPARLFENCAYLKKVTLPDGMQSIASTFILNSDVDELILNDNDKFRVENGCLLQNGAPNSVLIVGVNGAAIPNKVSEIKPYAFAGRSKITSLSIPSTVTQIGEGAFSNCPALSNMTVESGGFSYYMHGGCLIEMDSMQANAQEKLLFACHTGAMADLSELEHLTSVASYAFENADVTEVILPDCIKTIDEFAFTGCKATGVTIGADITNIGYHAFENCALTLKYNGTKEVWDFRAGKFATDWNPENLQTECLK